VDGLGAGKTYGKYRLLAKLGQGGTAQVYLAVLPGPSGFNKLAVLKILRPELSGHAEYRRMFLNEARLAARLNHANVVQTHEVFEIDRNPIIVMEYLEGVPLSTLWNVARQRGQPLPLGMHLRILCEVLSGLHYSHELHDYDGTPLGLVHRDMTPHNVFVTFDGKISLLDFGIAKFSRSLAEQTETGVIKGKIRYMPPEQLLGEEVDRRTDIFAMGVMIWEALVGEKMWGDISDGAVSQNIVNGCIPSPRTARPEVPEELERICMKALAIEPENRYPTAAELQTELEQWLVSDTSNARTIGQFVLSLFGETRAQTKELIERQLAELSAVEIPLSVDDGSESAAVKETGSVGPPADRTVTIETTPRRRIWPTAAAIMVTVTIAVFFGPEFVKRAPTTEAAPAVLPATPAASSIVTPPPPPPAPETQQVTITLAASPPGAKLYLDDRPLPSNPFSSRVLVDSDTHVVRGEASGYTTKKEALAFDKDVAVTLRLEREKVASRLPTVVHRPPQKTPPSTPTVSCEPPFYIDSDGIRRVKLECLSSSAGSSSRQGSP
jgi:serine/threonine-protein kinase